MKPTRRWLPGFFCLALAVPAWPQSFPLGRLFFTPAERAALDRQRRAGRGDSADAAAMTMDGLVTNSRGRRTVWINGQPRTELDAQPPAMGRLKVGETLHLPGGERTDLLAGGKLSVSRSGPAPLRP